MSVRLILISITGTIVSITYLIIYPKISMIPNASNAISILFLFSKNFTKFTYTFFKKK